MKLYVELIFSMLVAFFISVIIAPFIIKFIKSKKAKQPIYEYVSKHASKSGTPTMGGIIFLISFFIVGAFLVNGYTRHIFVCVLYTLLNAAVGLYDDILKIKCKQNLGLKPYQKLIFQTVLSSLLGVYMIKSGLTYLIIPFANISVNMGWFTIILTIILGIFFINSVNLTDGLDGLVSLITLVVCAVLAIILSLIYTSDFLNFLNFANNATNFAKIYFIFLGAILGYIFYNCFPAKIFMGDTGSLAIGAFLVATSFMCGMQIYLLIIGICYVASGVSVIMQVAYYKLTKKRIFKMAPLHHHFELCGVHESKISLSYFLITLIISFVVIMFQIMVL